jgi:hypothetical protein
MSKLAEHAIKEKGETETRCDVASGQQFTRAAFQLHKQNFITLLQQYYSKHIGVDK